MQFVRKRLTYANVMSSLAVFLVVAGGSALAANQLAQNSVGTKQLKNNAVTAAKIKNNAVSGGKIANGAVSSSKLGGGAVGASNLGANSVTGPAIADGAVSGAKIGAGAVGGGNLADGSVSGTKIANGAIGGEKIAGGAVGTGNLANASVTREKLAPGERSEVLTFEEKTSTVELAHPIGSAATKILTAELPPGQWLVSANVNLIYSIEAEEAPVNGTECFLIDDGTTIGEGGDTYRVGLFFFAGNASMDGVSNGGTISVLCKSFNKNSFGVLRQIIATRVGSVNGAS